MKLVVVEGGSAAYGWYDQELNGWANRLGLEAMPGSARDPAHPTIVTNHAMPGLALGAILHSLDNDMRTSSSDTPTVVLSVGINEAKVMPGNTRPIMDVGRFAVGLESFSAIVAARGAKAVFVGPQPIARDVIVSSSIGAIIDRDRVREYAEAMRREAEETGMPYIDAYALLEREDMSSVLASDGVHPNALGHMILHRAISTSLQSLDAL